MRLLPNSGAPLGDTPADKAKAEVALKAMKRSLRGWLSFRNRMDDYVRGDRDAPRAFRRPGAKPLPKAAISATLRDERFDDESTLARTLHALLSEVGLDEDCLPDTDVAEDPDAAVKLAEIAIAGACPSELPTPAAQGLVWFVLAIPIAGVVLLGSQFIKSRADVAKDRERLRCIRAGACTDSGFWIKTASVLVIGWIAWDKLGLRERATGLLSKGAS